MSTCRHCQNPAEDGQTTCFKHADTDPVARAMLALPDEMQHTPPATKPVTAVLRVPRQEEEDEEEVLLTDVPG